MIFVVLYNYLNCGVGETIDTGYTTNINCNTNYKIILLNVIYYLLVPAFENRPI